MVPSVRGPFGGSLYRLSLALRRERLLQIRCPLHVFPDPSHETGQDVYVLVSLQHGPGVTLFHARGAVLPRRLCGLRRLCEYSTVVWSSNSVLGESFWLVLEFERVCLLFGGHFRVDEFVFGHSAVGYRSGWGAIAESTASSYAVGLSSVVMMCVNVYNLLIMSVISIASGGSRCRGGRGSCIIGESPVVGTTGFFYLMW